MKRNLRIKRTNRRDQLQMAALIEFHKSELRRLVAEEGLVTKAAEISWLLDDLISEYRQLYA